MSKLFIEKLLLLFILLFACLPLATAQLDVKTVRIHTDYGGSIADYIEKYETIRDKNEKVQIDGICISACTLVLGTVPRVNICATPYGQFAFHSAKLIDEDKNEHFSREGTRIAWHIYPQYVRDYLKNKFGWDGNSNEPHPDLMYAPATDLVQPCK